MKQTLHLCNPVSKYATDKRKNIYERIKSILNILTF